MGVAAAGQHQMESERLGSNLAAAQAPHGSERWMR